MDNERGYAKHQTKKDFSNQHEISAHRLFAPILLNVPGQASQRTEYAVIVFIVGTELEAVFLGDHQGYLENIDRIETEAITKNRRYWIDITSGDREI
jgi:hypothetical protein